MERERGREGVIEIERERHKRERDRETERVKETKIILGTSNQQHQRKVLKFCFCEFFKESHEFNMLNI